MQETRQVVIKGVTITKGDTVKIKFRKLEDIIQDKKIFCRVSEIIEHYDIKSHMVSFCQGEAYFIVRDTTIAGDGCLSHDRFIKSKNGGKNVLTDSAVPEITIDDFNDGSHWNINEVLIESISVEDDVADSYYSEEHQLSLVLIDSVLYVNGKPVTNADSKIFEMFEKVLADAAIKKALSVNFNEFSSKDLNF
jgi:hypothetical protein